MNLNKKGFTLIEILATITIMLIIFSLAMVSINGVMKKKQSDQYDTYIEGFKSYVDVYIEENYSIKQNILWGDQYCFKLSTLAEYNEIDIPYNPFENKKRFDENSVIFAYNNAGIIEKKYYNSIDEVNNEYGGCYEE